MEILCKNTKWCVDEVYHQRRVTVPTRWDKPSQQKKVQHNGHKNGKTRLLFPTIFVVTSITDNFV